MGLTPIYELPYPESPDPADVPTDMRELAERVEAVLAAAVKPALILIEDKLLSAAGVFDFTAIPQTFAHLRLEVYARASGAVVARNVHFQANGDAAGNYDTQWLAANVAAYAAAEGLGQAQGYIGDCPAATAPAGAFAAFVLAITHYRSGGQKVFTSQWSNKTTQASGGVQQGQAANFWRGLAAINRLRIYPGTADTFAAGSRATLYGVAV
jgi:hypothetical protein